LHVIGYGLWCISIEIPIFESLECFEGEKLGFFIKQNLAEFCVVFGQPKMSLNELVLSKIFMD